MTKSKTKTKWTAQLPPQEGWYWIKYHGKHGTVKCPAYMMYFGDEESPHRHYFVRTARSDSFSNNTRKQFGYVRFGPRIVVPE